MTHASPEEENRHDSVIRMTGRSGRGTARQTIRIDEALWERFGAVAEGQGTDRSALVREFITWYVRDPAAKMPHRPDAGEKG